jgi:two-component system NtrC family sensor kinase
MVRHGSGADSVGSKPRRKAAKRETAPSRKKKAPSLHQQLDMRSRELAEALEHQTAMREVLSIISRSPKSVQPVLDSIVESAVRLSGALFAVIHLTDGEYLRLGASNHRDPDVLGRFFDEPVRIDRSIIAGRALLDGRSVQVSDVLADPEYAHDFAKAGQWRSVLAVPMMRNGSPLGVLVAGKAEPEPFSDAQVVLLSSFADQAVIAIDNGRLIQELDEALQQQTATAEILKTINGSVFDLSSVLRTLVQSGARFGHVARGGDGPDRPHPRRA